MTSETTKLDDFSTGGLWDAEAHVRFLRSSAGASSGFTADLIEQLYRALTATRPETGDHAGKMVGKAGDLVASEDVKPCPFCGSAGVSGRTGEGIYFAGCDNADCIAFMVAYDFTNETAAVTAWNDRAVDTIDRPTSTGEVGELTRWDLEPTQVEGFMVIDATESTDGRWVKFEDVALYASPREGHVEVPVEPTEAMIRAGYQERDRPGSGAAVSGIYRAMIRAALPHNQGKTKP